MKGAGNMYNSKNMNFGLMMHLAKKDDLDYEVEESYHSIIKENPGIDQATACRYALDEWDIIY